MERAKFDRLVANPAPGTPEEFSDRELHELFCDALEKTESPSEESEQKERVRMES